MFTNFDEWQLHTDTGSLTVCNITMQRVFPREIDEFTAGYMSAPVDMYDGVPIVAISVSVNTVEEVISLLRSAAIHSHICVYELMQLALVTVDPATNASVVTQSYRARYAAVDMYKYISLVE